MPSVQPLGADRAPPRERELGVHGGSDTDAPVRQQSTSPVSRDKPVRARRRVPLSGFDCSHPKRSRHLPSSGRGYAPGCPKYESHDDSGKRFDNGSDLRTLANPPSRTDSLAGKASRDIRRVTLVAHPRRARPVGDRFRLTRSPAFASALATFRVWPAALDIDAALAYAVGCPAPPRSLTPTRRPLSDRRAVLRDATALPRLSGGGCHFGPFDGRSRGCFSCKERLRRRNARLDSVRECPRTAASASVRTLASRPPGITP